MFPRREAIRPTIRINTEVARLYSQGSGTGQDYSFLEETTPVSELGVAFDVWEGLADKVRRIHGPFERMLTSIGSIFWIGARDRGTVSNCIVVSKLLATPIKGRTF